MSRVARVWIDDAAEPCEHIDFDTFDDLSASLTTIITQYNIGAHVRHLRGGKTRLNARSLLRAPDDVDVHVKRCRPGELVAWCASQSGTWHLADAALAAYRN